MKKFTNFLLALSIILGVIAAAGVLSEIFSTKLNKYYRVDDE